jgi:carbon monoxide dehydrogenase subunit G
MSSMQFDRDLVVRADPQTCWSVLTDVPKLVGWVSIVDDAKEIAPLDRYTAVLMDRLGPFKLKADLDIEVSDVIVGERIRVRASGEDRQVSSRISIEALLTISELDGAGSQVKVNGSYAVVGRVATMGAGMIRQKAVKILDEFLGHAATELGAG